MADAGLVVVPADGLPNLIGTQVVNRGVAPRADRDQGAGTVEMDSPSRPVRVVLVIGAEPGGSLNSQCLFCGERRLQQRRLF